MVVCKYFMEGYCRYGNQCRYEHVNPYDSYYGQRGSEYDRPSGKSVLRSSTTSPSTQQQFVQQNQQFGQQNQQFGQQNQQFGQQNQQFGQQNQQFAQQNFQSPQENKPSGAQKFNIHDLMQVVSKDILQAEKGNQWPLTCYSPYKDLQNIPDLVDYSPEELRWEYYIAVQNGRLPVCQAIVQQLQANAAKVNNKLKKKDTAYSVIERWLREGEAQSHQEGPSVGTTGFESSSMTNTAHISIPSNTQAEISFSFSLPQQQTSPMLQQQPVTSLSQQPAFMQQQLVQGFQQQPTSGNIFGGSQVKISADTDTVDNSAYSSIEELSQSELDAFRDKFVFGCIPTKPPPKELC